MKCCQASLHERLSVVGFSTMNYVGEQSIYLLILAM